MVQTVLAYQPHARENTSRGRTLPVQVEIPLEKIRIFRSTSADVPPLLVRETKPASRPKIPQVVEHGIDPLLKLTPEKDIGILDPRIPLGIPSLRA